MIQTVNERAFLLVSYAPPFIATTTNQKEFVDNEASLIDVVSNIFHIPRGRIMTFEKWASIYRIFSMIDIIAIANYSSSAYIYKESFIKKIESFFRSNNDINIISDISLRAIISFGVLESAGIVRNEIKTYELLKEYTIRYELVPEEEFITWAKITDIIIEERLPSIENKIREWMSYSIPFGQSPNIELKTVQELIQNPKNLCWIPLTAATVHATWSHLIPGQFLLCIQTIGTGGIASLLIFGFTSLINFLSQRMKPSEEGS